MLSVERSVGGEPERLAVLAFDEKWNLYVANHGGGRVVRIAPSGQMSTVLESEDSWSPAGVALARGDLYVLEFGGMPLSVRVRRRSADGRVTTLAAVCGGRPVP